MSLQVRERPPLRLDVGIKTPDGNFHRLGTDERNPANVPQIQPFTTTMPGGYEQGGVILPRKPGIEYPDLKELSDVAIRGAGGDTVWEGRIDTIPAQSGDQHALSPTFVGWQDHLDANEAVQEIYVSQDPSVWGDSVLARQLGAALTGVSTGDMSWSSQNGGLICSLPNSPVGAASIAENWFTAPAGVLIASIMYLGNDVSMPAGWQQPLLFESPTDNPPGAVPTDVMTLDGALHTLVCSAQERYIVIRVYSNGTPATPAAGAMRQLTAIGVYGATGIPTYPIDAITPNGVLASDVIAHGLGKYGPLLNFSTGPNGSIQPSTFVIPHLVFTSLPTKLSDLITAATQYELLDWAIWENRTFYMNARGARGRDWIARVGPSQLQNTGPSTARIWNSIVVQYNDVLTGTTKTVGPPGSGCDTEDPSLVDTDPQNPANQVGETRRATTAMGTGSPSSAIKVAGSFLQEQKLLDQSGQANLVGHVQDTNGVWWPASKPRGGDTVRFIDAADPSPRRLVKTSYDPANVTNGVSLDAPPDGLQELLDQYSIELIDAGLS